MNQFAKKQVLIVAGPNGAGKTTFARTFLAPIKDHIRFINADYIATGLSPFDPGLVAIRAGKIMLEEMENCFQRGESFAIETTLSSRNYLKHIKRWQQADYNVRLIYLSLKNVDISIERVARRVAQGGHDIPKTVVRRRFKAGLELLHSDYRHIVNEWLLYDNTGNEPMLLRQGVNK
ncbi:MAG: zeta toxin family protein [Proteobacteria bacterium]|nr:zeta toxin family protein [Pseudomonadota bacterium]